MTMINYWAGKDGDDYVDWLVGNIREALIRFSKKTDPLPENEGDENVTLVRAGKI